MNPTLNPVSVFICHLFIIFICFIYCAAFNLVAWKMCYINKMDWIGSQPATVDFGVIAFPLSSEVLLMITQHILFSQI